MIQITKPWLPTVNQPAVNRNPEHWPAEVQRFLATGYGGEIARKDAEAKRGGDEHAPPHICYQIAVAWCGQIDNFVSDYFLLPKGSFRDSALDRSAKDLISKGDA